jgi:hypothetical protein
VSKVYTISAVVLLNAGLALGGVQFEIPALTYAEPGETVSVSVNATSSSPLVGAILFLQTQSPLEIVGISLDGGIFESNHLPMTTIFCGEDLPTPQYAIADILAETGSVLPPGKLVDVSIYVPVGAVPGDYFFRTWMDIGAYSGAAFETAPDPMLFQGCGIIRVPEPTACLLSLTMMSLLTFRFWKKGSVTGSRER